MKNVIKAARVAAAIVTTTLVTSVSAQDYPSQPIRLVVPFSAGGPSDSQARLLGQKLSEVIKQPVIVENRPGGAGSIGVNFVSNAKPDGYTLLFCSTGPLAINPHIFSEMSDPLKDLTPVGLVSSAPSVLAVHPDVPASNIDELIELIRTNPGKFSYASGGEGTTQHLSGELFKKMAGLEMLHVPYKGEGQSTIDVLGGHIPIIFNSVGTGLPNFEAGNLRALAVTSAQRNPALPNIPTLAESGIPDYEVTAWQGIFAPAGTPNEIIVQLNAAIREVLELPDFIERLESVGNVPAAGTVDDFSAFLQRDVPRWATLVELVGIEVR